MKKLYTAASAIVFLVACNSTPAANTTSTNPLDTVGLAEFQKQKALYVASELDSTQAPPANTAATPAAAAPRRAASTSKPKSGSNTSASGTGASTDAGAGTASDAGSGTAAAPEKKGWSKTAKGAVIGGVTGAAAGAIINKKNRGAGAIIGGVVGAGAGAVIGNAQDKKDGRH
ncbi:MAG: glycine zipper family protein [Chitinophagaceae bacterium]|nr:MAG: glycine zipper family protein [Chitinophagaceae bacterium]